MGLEEFHQTVHDLRKEAGHHEPAWTTKLVQHHLEETYGVKYSIPSCRRLLKEGGPSYQQPRPETAKAEPEGSERFDEELKKAGKWTPQKSVSIRPRDPPTVTRHRPGFA